jgi:hypothetical protein
MQSMDLKNKYIENIQHNLSYFGSNFDIANALNCGQDKIIKYSELKNYNSLDELLPNSFDYKIILLETARNTGHWTCVIRMNDIIECFNSYGISIDSEWKFIPDSIERMLGQSTRYLKNLIKKDNTFKIVNNMYEFQSQQPHIATCSRWVILRIETARMGYSLRDFINMIDKQVQKTEIPPDILVLDYVKFSTDHKI